MHSYNDKTDKPINKVRGVSLQVGLWDWLYREADREEHGNVSRLVQEAVREFRDRREFERSQLTREAV